jgi:hypothetical protein
VRLVFDRLLPLSWQPDREAGILGKLRNPRPSGSILKLQGAFPRERYEDWQSGCVPGQSPYFDKLPKRCDRLPDRMTNSMTTEPGKLKDFTKANKRSRSLIAIDRAFIEHEHIGGAAEHQIVDRPAAQCPYRLSRSQIHADLAHVANERRNRAQIDEASFIGRQLASLQLQEKELAHGAAD